ncbi:hypothetical protein BH11ACT2_BH11ACT2_11860 [soil metagenome]
MCRVAESDRWQSGGMTVAPRRRWLAGAIVAAVAGPLVLFAMGGVAVANRQPILDRITAANVALTPTLQAYEHDTTMTAQGRLLFQASRPVIAPAASFNAECGTSIEGSGVLGCYLPTTARILLFDVTDPRLDGLEQSVAAHEMLHAAWARMGTTDRAALAKPLEAEATRLERDPAFATLMSGYAHAEPGERVNELHSIIGTQVASLPPVLERHYARYFSDRPAVAAMYQKAEAVFQGIQATAAQLADQLTTLKGTIDGQYASYTNGYDSLNSDIARFNKRAANGSISTQKQFSRERAGLVKRRDDLDALYATIQTEKTTWDATRAQLEAINADAEELNESVNISPYSGIDPG